MRNDLPDLGHLSAPGAIIVVRVTPKAAANRISVDGAGGLHVAVTAVPEGGKATAAVVRLLAKTLGIAKSRLVLIRGETSRDKTFRVAP